MQTAVIAVSCIAPAALLLAVALHALRAMGGLFQRIGDE